MEIWKSGGLKIRRGWGKLRDHFVSYSVLFSPSPPKRLGSPEILSRTILYSSPPFWAPMSTRYL
jgi:hypothetical protein